MSIEIFPNIRLYADTYSFALETTYPRSMAKRGRNKNKDGSLITTGVTKITWYPSIESALREAFQIALSMKKELHLDIEEKHFRNAKVLFRTIKKIAETLTKVAPKIKLYDLKAPTKLEKKIKDHEEEIEESEEEDAD